MRERRSFTRVAASAFAGVLICVCLLFCAGEGKAKFEDAVAYDVNNVSRTINEDVSLNAESDNAIGVRVMEDQGKAISVTVGGSITVDDRTDTYEHQGADGMQVMAYGSGSKATVTVDGGIRTVNTWTAGETGNLDTSGFQMEVSDQGSVEVTVNGGISAKTRLYDPKDSDYTWTAGISCYNLGGNVKATVNGDIATDDEYYGVALNAHTEGDGPASSFYEINGDLTGDTIGVRTSNANPEGTAEIIVNGTVTGDICVSLEGDYRDKIRLTFWRAQSRESENLIRRDEEMDEASAAAYEKKINYILRTDPESDSLITMDTETYHGYHIAREGEKVTLRVSAPDGYEVEAVYGLPDRKTALPKAAEGSWVLEVPKGGGVEISVKLKKAQPAPVPKTGDRSEPLLWTLLILAGTAGIGGTVFSRKAN